MADDLGLDDHHQQQAVNFIRFSRFKRIQSLKGIEQCFHDVEDSKMYDDTYTYEEVKEILDELLKVVTNEVDIELLNSSHTSALLLKQLLTQAQNWHLKLICDVSELENRELLEQIAAFEEKELSLSPSHHEGSKMKLKPIEQTGAGGSDLLKMEIERLKGENKNLLSVVHKQEGVVNKIEEVNKSLIAQVKNLGEEPKSTAAMNELEHEVENLRIQLGKQQSGEKANEKLMEDLTSTKHMLLKARKDLEDATGELDMKFQQTSLYKNLKGMLDKKNEQLKTLRLQLQKYEKE